MAVNTHTQVAAVSKIKMATAFLFLGGAALAASAAGGLAGKTPKNGPDLVIKSIFLEQYEEPEQGGAPAFGYNLYTITYENIGNVVVTKPFNIMVQSSPNPYQTWGGGDPVMYLASIDDASGDGYSGGFENFDWKTAASAGNNLYVIPVTSPDGKSITYPGLNKYLLNGVSADPGSGWSGGFAPGDVGQIKVYISKFYQDMLGKGGKAKVGAYVDYLKTNRNGVIMEKNEQNNTKNVNFDKSSYAVAPSNLCGPDYIAPELAKDICKTQSGSFICIDKYTQWYSACVPKAGDCAKKIKTTVPCEVDVAGGQPYFDTIEVGIGGADWESTKKFTNISYALGKYPTPDKIDAIILYYPYEKKNENKIVRIKVTAKNASTNTVYGFHPETVEYGSYEGLYSPSDTDYTVYNSGFADLFKSSIDWGSAPGYTFYTKSAPITLYLGVKNNDTTYFGFPNTKIADDAVAIQILPLSPPASQPPTSTSGSGTNQNTTVTSSLSVVANAIQPMTIQPSSNQLVGDYTFTIVGNGQTLCLNDVRSQAFSQPANAIQFGSLVIHEYADPSPGYQFSSAFSKSYMLNSFLVFDFNSKFSNPPCVEANKPKRLQFFLNDVTFNPQPYPATLTHELLEVSFTNQVTAQNGKVFSTLSNGMLEAKPLQQ